MARWLRDIFHHDRYDTLGGPHHSLRSGGAQRCGKARPEVLSGERCGGWGAGNSRKPGRSGGEALAGAASPAILCTWPPVGHWPQRGGLFLLCLQRPQPCQGRRDHGGHEQGTDSPSFPRWKKTNLSVYWKCPWEGSEGVPQLREGKWNVMRGFSKRGSAQFS